MNGLIAFFDILGYQSFLENNSPTQTAEKVLNLLTTIPVKLKNEISNHWDALTTKEGSNEFQKIPQELQHLIFSDTIVLSLRYPEGCSESWRKLALVYFITFSGRLTASMFAYGLPVRGAIVNGEFLIKDMCLAGKAIVEAYRLSELLDFSGVVFSGDLRKTITEIGGEPPFLSEALVDYMSPLKGAIEQKFLNLNWVHYLDRAEEQSLVADVDTFVLRSFWAHGKDCPRSVDRKISNTIKSVRRFVIHLKKNSRTELKL